jgi:hypothetical protein
VGVVEGTVFCHGFLVVVEGVVGDWGGGWGERGEGVTLVEG